VQAKTVLSCLFAVSLTVAVAAHGQQHPNIARGYLPQKTYEANEVDTINVFNGTLNVRIPLGQTYRVNADLSYQLAVTHASNAWERGEHYFIQYSPDPPYSEEVVTSYSFPERHMNAGFGWILTLGQMFSRNGSLACTPAPSPSGGCGETYLSPDGAQHVFYDKLHGNNPAEAPYTGGGAPQWIGYTRDGTYLRAKRFADRYEIEFPDGNVHTFDRSSGMLNEIADSHGNAITVVSGARGSGPFATSSKWTISDSTGRVQYVYFRPAPSYAEIEFDQVVTHEMVDYVDLAAFDGARALYYFDYNSDGLPSPSAPPSMLLPRRCPVTEPSLAETVRVPILGAIRIPENLEYRMTYDLAGQQYCSGMSLYGGTASGNILSMKLPTGASIDYSYGVYTYPSPTDNPLNRAFTEVPGIVERVIWDGLRKVSHTSYGQDRDFNDGRQDGRDQRRVTIRRNSGGDVMNMTRHYFTTCVLSGCANMGEYGLPLTRSATSNGAYLSTETMAPDATTVDRSTYVLFEGDGNLTPTLLPLSYDFNRRVKRSRILYEDGKSTDVEHSDFDGLGNYRQTVTTSNIADGSQRTEYANFNPGRGTFNVTSNGTVSGTFVMPAATAIWRWNTYDVQRATEGGVTSSRVSCFDSSGFLTSRRVSASFGSSPSLQPNDLVVIFGNDGHGNVASEQYLGGDTTPPPLGGTGAPAPTSTTCVPASSTETSRVKHAYAAGSLKSSYAVAANGLPMSNFLQDRVIDSNTGLVKSSREASSPNTNGSSANDGLQILFQYDLLGRLRQETPQGSNRGASKRHVYSPDTRQVDVFEESAPNATLLRKNTTILDGLGRVIEERRSIPNDVTASRTWQYDELGRVTAASSWGTGTPSFTRFGYDNFDRLTRQEAPDGAVVTHVYTGVSNVETVSRVRTGGTASTFVHSDALKKTSYDSAGRVRRVVEPTGVITRYSYDVGKGLRHVCADEANNCTQNRWFTYDNRGFLVAEQSPELGASGNGSATYLYDARGSQIRRTIGSPNGDFDVWMDYDRAGRLTRVYEAKTTDGAHRILKLFDYGLANVGSDFKNGKPTRAVRYNWVAGYNIQIVEDFLYAAREGRISHVSTYDYECSLTSNSTSACNVFGTGLGRKRDFTQAYTYDALGAIATLGYPQCLHAPCATATSPRTATNSYDKGWLTAVNWTGSSAPSTITYHDNGLVNTVTHGNLVQDQTELDPWRLPRPFRMTTTNVMDPGSCVAPSFDLQPQSQMAVAAIPPATVTLAAHAAGEVGFPVTYQWYVGTAPDQNSPIGTNSNHLVVSPTTTTRYWVKATNTCSNGGTSSDTATVTVCALPSITSAPSNTAITRSQTATLTVSAGGSAPYQYQWYRMSGATPVAINGETAPSITVEPIATTGYRVRVTNSCGQITSSTATVTVAEAPTVPASVTVVSNGSQNTVTWTASVSTVGILRYEIARLNGPVSWVWTPAAPVLTDGPAGLTTGAAYLYRVRAVDNNGVASAWSAYDFAVRMIFEDDPLVPGVTQIRGIHVGQLRQAIDGLRTEAHLPRVWSSYSAVTGFVSTAAVLEMRTKLNEARIALGAAPISFNGSNLTPGVLIFQSHLQVLRNGVK